MTEPRTPGDPGQEPNAEPAAPAQPTAPADADAAGDSPTQEWPSLRPSSESGPSAASWATPTPGAPGAPGGPAEPASATPPAEPAAPAAASPYEPTDPLPDSRLETGGIGATPAVAGAPAASRSRPGLRWGLALLGILIVIGATALIVYLVGGRPASSNGLGYMPATTAQYSEIRLDLPGDQRQKLAGFLATFPGFKDQTQIEPKLNDVFDRIVRAASDGKQTYTTDIAPWFGGQVSIGTGLPALPSTTATPTVAAMGVDNMLIVIGIKDRTKAQAWLTSFLPADGKKESYNGADIWTASNPSASAAVALTDKVMLLGSVTGVRAAVDSKGEGSLANDADFKTAFAQIDRDYVLLSVIRIRPYVEAVTTMVDKASPGALAGTQLDETITAMIPAWQASIARFENDALVSNSVYPAYAIGYDSTNHKSTLTGRVPAKTFIYAETHDVGPALSAVLAKFRALPETKGAFQAFDQAVSLLGGFDAVFGWWGDAAFVVAPGADGTIGGGLVIQHHDKAAAERLFTTLRGFLTLAGGSSGINIRDEDHGGTKITILDLSASPGMTPGSLPAGYKPEFAYAVSNDVVVAGYGRDFVASVLDAGAGPNLASDERFKKLVGRVGEENLSLTYVDINAMRELIEPLIRQTTPPEAWTAYESDVKPYLEHLDAMISSLRKDGALDRADGALTTR